jgi:hypothetical protein
LAVFPAKSRSSLHRVAKRQRVGSLPSDHGYVALLVSDVDSQMWLASEGYLLRKPDLQGDGVTDTMEARCTRRHGSHRRLHRVDADPDGLGLERTSEHRVTGEVGHGPHVAQVHRAQGKSAARGRRRRRDEVLKQKCRLPGLSDKHRIDRAAADAQADRRSAGHGDRLAQLHRDLQDLSGGVRARTRR